MTTIQIQKPNDLDNSRLHTRAEVREWKAANAAYFAAIRAEADAERKQKEAAKQKANRPLTDDEYDAMARQREEKRLAAIAEREAEEAAKLKAKSDYLASTPDVAEIAENSEFNFLQAVISWAAKGYTLPDDGIKLMIPSFYSISMNAPVAPTKKVK
jgi:hypothetical protein